MLTGRRLLILALVTLALGFGVRYYLQQQTADTVRGQVVTYQIDREGAADVSVSDRIIFNKPDASARFDSYVERTKNRQTDVGPLTQSAREQAETIGKAVGRDMQVSGFNITIAKQEDFGESVSTFRWTAFAGKEGSAWKIAFPPAKAITMNQYSSLTVLLPEGAKLESADPKPDEATGDSLTWRGPREMPWPTIAYELP